MLGNRTMAWLTGVTLHDTGCSLKAYRAEVVKNIKLYGNLHRFIPAVASWYGVRVGEVPVRDNARAHGQLQIRQGLTRAPARAARPADAALHAELRHPAHPHLRRPGHRVGRWGCSSAST